VTAKIHLEYYPLNAKETLDKSLKEIANYAGKYIGDLSESPDSV